MGPDGDARADAPTESTHLPAAKGIEPQAPDSNCQPSVAQILDAVPHPVFWKDCQGVYLGCNDVFARAVGLRNAAEIVGKTDFDLPWPRAEAEAYRADDRLVIESRRPRRHIIEPLQQADGTRLWVDTTKVPLLTADGQVYGVLGVYDDITERKPTEEALRESEQRYRNFIANASEGIYRIDFTEPVPIDLPPEEIVTRIARHAVVGEVNESLARMYGLQAANMIGRPATDFAPNYGQRGALVLQRDNHQVLDEETIDRDKDGRPVYLSESFTGLVENGHLIRIWGVQREITERKQAEQTLRESEHKYRALSQEFMTILEAIPGSLVLISPDLRIVWANEFAAASLGLRPAEMLEQHCYTCRHNRSSPCEVCLVQRCFASGKPESEDGETPDGRIWELHAAPVLGDQGEVKGVIEIAYDVTEYRRAGRELKASESRLRSVFRAAPIGIIFTIDRVIISANDSMYELTGYSQAELLGKNSRHLYFTQEEFEDVGRNLYAPAPAGKHTSVESRFRRKDGTAIDVLLTGAPLRPEEPAAGFVVTVQDITQLKSTELALRSRIIAMTRPLDDTTTITFSDLFDLEEIQKLQDAFTESSGVAQLITDPDGNPITRPSGFCRLCAEFVRQSEKGRQKCAASDAALGRMCVEGPAVRPCLSAGLWGAGASIMVGGRHIANWLIGQVRNESLDLAQISRYAAEIDADPEEFRRALLEVPVMSEEQFRKVAQTLHVLANELSTKAYQNVQQARFIADLKRAEDERDRLFNSSIDMLSIGSLNGHFRQVNPAWTRSLGWSAEELKRTHPSEFVHPDDLAATIAATERLQQGQELRSFENRYRCKDGTYRWMSWNSYPLMEQGLIFTVCRDVTERKAAEEERAKLEAQLRQSQKMEAVGQLAGGVAHDFNNILTAVFGQLDLAVQVIETQYPAAQSLLDGMHQIERSAQRASDLTRQLLAFSRRQVTRPEVLNVNTTLRGLEKMLRRLLTENIVLDQILAADLAPTKVDAGQLEQVIINLVVNARDAMPNGGRLTIETHNTVLDESYSVMHPGAQPGEHVVLTVTDTGHGMDAITVEHIFEPFFTTKPQGRGTGLGLSTVYGIIRQAGGHVTVYSELGRGTCFKINLPAVHEPLSAGKPARAESAPPGGTETLIVCEDEPAVRDLTAQMLAGAGYHVLVAPNAGRALDLATGHAGPLALLITDVIMPDMNGRQLSEALTGVRPGIRTLFVSGYTSDLIAHHGVLDENVDFLEKPFSRRQLLEKVREVLDRAPSPDAAPSAGSEKRAH